MSSVGGIPIVFHSFEWITFVQQFVAANHVDETELPFNNSDS